MPNNKNVVCADAMQPQFVFLGSVPKNIAIALQLINVSQKERNL